MLAPASAVPHAAVEHERKEIYDSQVTEISFFPAILSNFLNRTQILGTPHRIDGRASRSRWKCYGCAGAERKIRRSALPMVMSGAARDQLCTEKHASLRSIAGG
jgi:hypothetical protein